MKESLRVLFLHASRDEANEYKVNLRLSRHVNSDGIQSYFIWQDATHDRTFNKSRGLPDDVVDFWDFGRNQNNHPRPPRLLRVANILLRFPGSFLFLVRAIRRHQPDIIYTTQQTYEVAMAHRLSRLFGIPHVIHVCYVVGPWLGSRTLKIIRKTPHVFTSCEFVRRSAIQAGVPAENMRTIHHMADPDLYDLPRDPAWLRQEFGWPEDTPVITAAARLDRDKNMLAVIETFALVAQTRPDARLLICGTPSPDTKYHHKLHARVEELGLQNYVSFAGFRDDLPRIFAGSDMFFLAPIKDAFSLVFLGAMSAGLPVVSVRSGSIPEMVDHGKTGLLADSNDYQALAEHILTLIADPQMARQMGEAGKKKVVKSFGPQVIANRWLHLLLESFKPQLIPALRSNQRDRTFG